MRRNSQPRHTAAVPAVEKAITVMRRLNAHGPAPLRQIAEAEEITRSHCHAILRTLCDNGWVQYDPHRRLYALGWRLTADTASAIRSTRFSEQIHDLIEGLSKEIGLPCVVSEPMGDGSFLMIDKVDGLKALEVSVRLGQHFPPDAPAQMRAYLAWQDAPEIAAAISGWRPVAYTRSTIVDRDKLERELALTRQRGYAVSRNEFTEGVVSVAVPIFDATRRVLLVLQCPGFTDDVGERIEEVAAAMRRVEAIIHRRWGVLDTPPESEGKRRTPRSPRRVQAPRRPR